ncbi:MAG: molecular chaperone [Polaromonas sp.]|nr:molecular chaperone [Polaromonas sp.]
MKNKTTILFKHGVGSIAAGLCIFLASSAAIAQSLSVLPVNIQMAPKQMATTLTVINQGAAETSVQIRAFAWKQVNGTEQLLPSDDVQVSPPIATIAPGATQVVRLVLRRAPQGSEATYRILLDQIPPVAESGTVRVALRLSIPVFALPNARAAAQVKYRVESKDGVATLVAVNEGTRHETLRDVTLNNGQGIDLKPAANASPYILAGATRSWPIAMGASGVPLVPGSMMQLTGIGDAGSVNEAVTVIGGP